MRRKMPKNPPPWEALPLVAHYLDLKTLAMASCVCKSWSLAMSSDHVWQPLCVSHYPCLSNLKTPYASVPYRRLYAIGFAASKRRSKPPPKPRLALDNIVFAIELSSSALRAPIITIAEPANIIDNDGGNQVFKFDIGVDDDGGGFPGINASEVMKVTWNVVLRGWEVVFTMMEWEVKMSCTAEAAVEGWSSEELPSPGCCWSGAGSGIVADLKVGFGGKGEREKEGWLRVEKVNVGMLRCADWRYVSIDDGLRYLQHFLLPCHHL